MDAGVLGPDDEVGTYVDNRRDISLQLLHESLLLLLSRIVLMVVVKHIRAQKTREILVLLCSSFCLRR